MQKKNGLFELKTPYDLFSKAKYDLKIFFKKPDNYSLFNLICTLNHLKEWTEKDKAHKHKGKFCRELANNPDYKIVKELCNNAKHFYDNGIGLRSKSFNGFTSGFSGAGDSLGQINYTVDGQDIRDIISRVFNKYKNFFEEKENI